MPPQAKGEIAKLSTRYWAALGRNAPAGTCGPGHDGGGRRRVVPGAKGRRRALRGGANGAAEGRNGNGLTR